MQEEDEDTVAVIITQKGSVQLTGAKILIGPLMDARDALLQYIRSQVIQPIVAPPQGGPPIEEDEDS